MKHCVSRQTGLHSSNLSVTLQQSTKHDCPCRKKLVFQKKLKNCVSKCVLNQLSTSLEKSTEQVILTKV